MGGGPDGDGVGQDLDHILIFGDPETRRRFLKRMAGTSKAPLQVVGQDIEFSYRFEITRPIGPHMRVCLTTESSRFEHLAVPLMGEHQAVNCGLALAMLDKLKQRGFNFEL